MTYQSGVNVNASSKVAANILGEQPQPGGTRARKGPEQRRRWNHVEVVPVLLRGQVGALRARPPDEVGLRRKHVAATRFQSGLFGCQGAVDAWRRAA